MFSVALPKFSPRIQAQIRNIVSQREFAGMATLIIHVVLLQGLLAFCSIMSHVSTNIAPPPPTKRAHSLLHFAHPNRLMLLEDCKMKPEVSKFVRADCLLQRWCAGPQRDSGHVKERLEMAPVLWVGRSIVIVKRTLPYKKQCAIQKGMPSPRKLMRSSASYSGNV